MANLTSTNVVLSDFGTQIFATDANLSFATAAVLPNSTEIEDVIGADNLGFTRDSSEYPVLAHGGWPKKALGAFKTDDMSLSMVRSEQGAYNDGSTYWFLNEKLKAFKANRAYFGIVIVRPVSGLANDDIYEARYWNVFCNGIDEGASGDKGREYTANLCRSGEPIELTVTKDAETGDFKFVKKA